MKTFLCEHPDCEDLGGFAYSGGLLRHQRVVHREHSEPKPPFMCSYARCTYHSGLGFSSKENLHEHLRRSHEASIDNQAADVARAAQSPEGKIASYSRRDRASRDLRASFEDRLL